MDAVHALLSLKGKGLKVSLGCNGSILVSYPHADVKDGIFLLGICGSGDTFEAACEDYLNQLHGKTLVFNAESKNRKEIRVL